MKYCIWWHLLLVNTCRWLLKKKFGENENEFIIGREKESFNFRMKSNNQKISSRLKKRKRWFDRNSIVMSEKLQSSFSSDKHVQVIARPRPLSENERSQNLTSCLSANETRREITVNCRSSTTRYFNYDHVNLFASNINQKPNRKMFAFLNQGLRISNSSTRSFQNGRCANHRWSSQWLQFNDFRVSSTFEKFSLVNESIDWSRFSLLPF